MSKFQIGQVWRRRDGYTSKIVGIDPQGTFPIHADNCGEDPEDTVESFSIDGSFNLSISGHPLDLVELLSPRFDFLAHLKRHTEFSGRVFGPGARAKGIVDHIRKELVEVEENPTDISEWIDVVILALDGAWRAGYSPEQIISALVAKHGKNEARTWPDWRTAPQDKAIEHDRSGE